MDKKVIQKLCTSFAHNCGKVTHESVLKDEVVGNLQIEKLKIVVDGTVGHGGHSEAILEKMSDVILIGFDKDQENLEIAEKRLKKFGRRVVLCHNGFEEMEMVLKNRKIIQVDAVLLDLGLSSSHIEESERGFSFRQNSPLDMRFNRDDDSLLTAAEILNSYGEYDLSRIFRDYGEEKKARILAHKILERRKENLFRKSPDLLKVIEDVYDFLRPRRHHPAARIFQALRIEVNQELEVLKRGLEAAYRVLRPKSAVSSGGRLAVISYHSLEDRIAKEFFSLKAKSCICPPEVPICICENKPKVKIITKKPLFPSFEEIKRNPRSRSAKLRVAEKLSN